MSLSIDDAIEQLQRVKKSHPLGGKMAFLVCIPEVPYVEVKQIKADPDQHGCVCLVMPKISQLPKW